MVRKTYRRKHSRKHQRGGGCGCGGSTVLGFPQNGGQMNSIIGSPNNSMNSGMNAPVNSGMNTGMNSALYTPRNSGMNSMNSGMSFNNSSYKNKQANSPFLSASNVMGGGFLGMFNAPSEQQQRQQKLSNLNVTPQNVVNRPMDPNSRIDELEHRLKKLETGGGFFGGRRLRRKSRKTRKH